MSRFWLALLLIISISWSCKHGSEVQQEILTGKWKIMSALRNGKETPYLRGGYFIIGGNSSMTVNLTGADEKGQYTIHDKILRMNNSKDFIIESLQKDSMTIRYAMNPQSEFLIYLFKDLNETR